MNWLGAHTDLLGIAVACLAVALSFATVVLGRRQRRQDNFLRVHEMLIDHDVQRGRALLRSYVRQAEVPSGDTQILRS